MARAYVSGPQKFGEHTFYMDGYLKELIDDIKVHLKKDNDYWAIITGKERGGKTTLASQLAFALQPDVTIENLCWKGREFVRRFRDTTKQSLIYDEGITGMNKKKSISRMNVAITSTAMVGGYKNHKVFICVPRLQDISEYFVEHRANNIFHVYRGADGNRGYFACWTLSDKERQLEKHGKLKSPTFTGRFTDYFPWPKDDYATRKDEVLDWAEKQTSDSESRMERKFKARLAVLADHLLTLGWTQGKVCEVITQSGYPYSDASLSELLFQYRERKKLCQMVPKKPPISDFQVSGAVNI